MKVSQGGAQAEFVADVRPSGRKVRDSGRASDLLKFKLTIAYDGTGYEGWQTQKVGVGVQQKIEEALQRLFPGVKRLHSSSRTDTGVHALGMVAHVEIPRAEFRMPVGKLMLAVNAHLPPDIRVMAVTRCSPTFHARFDAAGKQYRYCVWNHCALNPLIRHLAWHVPRKLDLTAMRQAARCFVGEHDFRSLAANRNYEMPSTVRRLNRCEIRRNGPLLTFVIEGEGFLYKMCRAICRHAGPGGTGPDRPSGHPAHSRSS